MNSRGTLTGRITLLAVGVAVLAALLTLGLTHSCADAPARRNLGVIADLTANRADTAIATKGLDAAVIRSLERARIQVATVGPDSHVTATAPLARAALNAARQRQLLAGKRISARTTVGGLAVFLQGRPTAGGGVLLVQRPADADNGSGPFVQRMMVALLIAAVVAVLRSIVAARRLARPLRRIAGGARDIEQGARGTAVVVEGPREVADVAHSLNAMSAGSPGRRPGRACCGGVGLCLTCRGHAAAAAVGRRHDDTSSGAEEDGASKRDGAGSPYGSMARTGCGVRRRSWLVLGHWLRCHDSQRRGPRSGLCQGIVRVV